MHVYANGISTMSKEWWQKLKETERKRLKWEKELSDRKVTKTKDANLEDYFNAN
jgi:TRAP-type C4-dicarboxylate transport system substrate-binding protein